MPCLVTYLAHSKAPMRAYAASCCRSMLAGMPSQVAYVLNALLERIKVSMAEGEY